MLLTIKNLKHSQFASHETACFEATVYVDGKRAFIASNDGQGSANMYYPIKGGDQLKVYKQVEAINAELNKEIIHGQYGELTNDLDMVIGELLDTELSKKELRTLLKKVCIIYCGRVMQFKITSKEYQEHTTDIAMAIYKKYSRAVILNRLTFDDAFEKFKEAA